jgi:hypothetical protein
MPLTCRDYCGICQQAHNVLRRPHPHRILRPPRPPEILLSSLVYTGLKLRTDNAANGVLCLLTIACMMISLESLVKLFNLRFQMLYA